MCGTNKVYNVCKQKYLNTNVSFVFNLAFDYCYFRLHKIDIAVNKQSLRALYALPQRLRPTVLLIGTK